MQRSGAVLIKIVEHTASCNEIEANIKHFQKKIGADTRTYRVPSSNVFVAFPEETEEDEQHRRRYRIRPSQRSLVRCVILIMDAPGSGSFTDTWNGTVPKKLNKIVPNQNINPSFKYCTNNHQYVLYCAIYYNLHIRTLYSTVPTTLFIF